MKNLASFLLSVMLICFSACSNNDDLVEVRQQVTPLKNLARSTTLITKEKITPRNSITQMILLLFT